MKCMALISRCGCDPQTTTRHRMLVSLESTVGNTRWTLDAITMHGNRSYTLLSQVCLCLLLTDIHRTELQCWSNATS